MFKAIILICSKHLKDERTDQAIFHILQGKKSIQTIQDVFLYKLDKYYSMLPKLKKEVFNDSIRQLEIKDYMQPSKMYDNSYTISEKGVEYGLQNTLPKIISHINGKKHSLYASKFEQRLFLFFQVLSNKMMKNKSYIPITDNYQIMRDVKALYRQLGNDSLYLANQLYTEISSVLKSIDEEYAHVFINRLSGFEHYGQSIQQSANDLHISEIDMRILWTAIIHYMLEKISVNKEKFPLLTFVSMRHKSIEITASAHQTKLLLAKGFSLEKLADKRQLKINTVFDHVIEITLHDDSFEISPFIDQESVVKIIQTAYDLDTYQLRDLKESLGDNYSYFQIRLALARGGALNR